MQQQVTVIDLEGQDAIVQGKRASACGDCAGKTSCSTMGSWKERFVELRITNTLHARIGDRVILEVPDNAVMHIAFKLYALPMLAFVFAGLGMRDIALWMDWPAVEAIAALAGFAAVVAYYVCYKLYLSTSQSSLDVHMTRLVGGSNTKPFGSTISIQVASSSD